MSFLELSERHFGPSCKIVGFIILAILFFPLPPSSLSASELVDRILAVVNEEIITKSDVDTYQALFSDQKNPSDVLDELIARKLLLKEADKFEIPMPSEEAVKNSYRDVVADLGETQNMNSLLGKTGLSTSYVEGLIRDRLRVDQLLEQRIRFFVFVSPQEVEAYLKTEEQLFQGRTEEERKTLAKEDLLQQKTEKRYNEYIERLRNRASIQIN